VGGWYYNLALGHGAPLCTVAAATAAPRRKTSAARQKAGNAEP